MSVSASRALARIARSGAPASAGSRARAASAASDWTAITLSPWATTSCSSRAIRVRSSATASRARSRWCCSAYVARDRQVRAARPSSQAPPSSIAMNA